MFRRMSLKKHRSSIDFSADGQFFAIGGDDGLLKIYDASNHNLLNSYNMLTEVQLTGQSLAT